MNFNSKRSVTDEQNERHKRILATILKEEGNKSCADCKTRNPTWASVNLGVFVCLTCSGIHRSLGVHISQVRSCNLDTWLPKQVEFCRVMGNVKGNRYWEARLPKDFRRPPSGNPNPELAAFIRAKYVDRAFAATDAQPPTIDNYLNHPYGADSSEAVHSPPAAPATDGPAPAATATTLNQPSNGTTPTKPPAPMTVDLLGGFDDLTVSTMPSSPPAAPASSDPFGSFVSAPPRPAVHQPAAAAPPANSQLNILEWTDFHAAAPPPASASSPALAQLVAASEWSGSLLGGQAPPAGGSSVAAAATSGLGHQRSHSISEGVSTAMGTGAPAATQPSRLGGHSKTQSVTQPELDFGNYHANGVHQTGANTHTHTHAHTHGRASNAPNGTGQNGNGVAGYDAEDLLAGLTIHHVMESMTPPSAPAAAAAASADPFSFSSSALSHGDAIPHVRGSHHKRHPSNLKATDEVLRLFDTAPSTGAAAASNGPQGTSPAAAASDDPFGDFIGGAGHHGAAQPSQMRQAPVVSNGLSGGLVANLL